MRTQRSKLDNQRDWSRIKEKTERFERACDPQTGQHPAGSLASLSALKLDNQRFIDLKSHYFVLLMSLHENEF